MAYHRGPDLRPLAETLRDLDYPADRIVDVLVRVAEMGTVEDCSLVREGDRELVEDSIPESGFWAWREFNRCGYASI